MNQRRQRPLRETSLRRSFFALRAGSAKLEVVAILLSAQTSNGLAQRPIDRLAASQRLVVAKSRASTCFGSS